MLTDMKQHIIVVTSATTLANVCAQWYPFGKITKSFHNISFLVAHLVTIFAILNYLNDWNENQEWIFVLLVVLMFMFQFRVSAAINHHFGEALGNVEKENSYAVGSVLGYMIVFGNCSGSFIATVIGIFKEKMF